MSDTPVPNEQELELDGVEDAAERGLPKSSIPVPTTPPASDPLPLPDGGMTPDQDAIGSG